MGKIDLEKEKSEELSALGRYYSKRSEAIIKEWRKTLPGTSYYGQCNTPEMKALKAELNRRYFEIPEKYKALQEKK